MPFGGEIGDGPQPLGQPAEREVRLLRDGQPRRVLLRGGLELGLLQACAVVERGLKLGAQRRGGGLVGLVPGQFGRERDVVVGQQPEPGVAQVGLDYRRLAGKLRLPAERLELAAKLGGQVHQPGHVGLHGLELAQRLFLAPAVLEYARRFFDQRSARLGTGIENVVEVTLSDDDVHLAAEAGVGEQFLHVEQPALAAVDRVLALAGAEQQPADRDLGVVDRQRAVAVVDGQRDLGAARAPGRPAVPAKTTSSILPPRSGLTPC